MARTYDDIYFTNCNNKLYLHLDGANGTNETVTQSTQSGNTMFVINASYFRIEMDLGYLIYPNGYDGSDSCSDWVGDMDFGFPTFYSVSNDDDLKLEVDFFNADPLVAYTAANFMTYTNDGGTYQIQNTDSPCITTNWWKDSIRWRDGIVRLKYYSIENSSAHMGSENREVANNSLTTAGATARSSSGTNAKWIYNAPPGTSGRAEIGDNGSTANGTPHGVVSNPIQSMATTSGCTGDPHVTTFDGCKYTL